MAIFLGSLNRSALRAAAQPPADDPVVDEPVVDGPITDRSWAIPPDGYRRVFFDDFSKPSGTSNSWQGINLDNWAMPSVDGQPDPFGRASTSKHPFFGSNSIVKPDGGLYMYGGRRPDMAPGGNAISNDERGKTDFQSRERFFYPGYTKPRIIRIRTEWDQRKGYSYQPWGFSSWVDVTRGGITFEHGWEMDLENKGSEYDPIARTFEPHFNNHIWMRVKGGGDNGRSQMSPLSYDVELPSNPRAQINIDIRWQRGSDFWDPYQTYIEWWTDEIVNGESTGNMVRRYHWSPRHMLEAKRSSSNWVKPSDAPPSDPLPPELANVAPSNIWAPSNKRKNETPYDRLGNLLFQPYIAAYDPSYTWWDVCRDSWTEEAKGRLLWHSGFPKEWFFLADDGNFFVSDYSDHHSHVDDEKCFSTVCWGTAVFDPD